MLSRANVAVYPQGLCTFITDKHQELLIRSVLSSEEAWLVVATQIERIFWDIADARVEARDVGGGSGNQRFETSTACIWSTFKAHQVMAEYLHYNFNDHPNMSSELVNHLMLHLSHAGGSGKDHSLDVKAHKALSSKLEGWAKMNNSRIDSLEGKLGRTEGPEKGGGKKVKIPLDNRSEEEEEEEDF
jgi:hypothetical protein